MLLSRDFEVLYANKALLDRLGHEKSEVIGNFCYRITHNRETPCEPPKDPCPVAEALKGNPCTYTHTHYDGAGNEFYVEVTAYPLKEGEEVTGFIHVARDITRLKRAEEERVAAERTRAEEAEKLTKKLQEKIEELEEFHDVTVGRELKMMRMEEEMEELKQRLRELEEKITKTSTV
jgi:PAS domain S-box-containing protein